jgi:hypothetical protein
VFYLIAEGTIIVLAVFHASRDPQILRGRA